MAQHIDQLLSRGVRLSFLFTAGIQTNYNHRSQFRTTFPRAARHPAVSTEFFRDADHAFSDQASRDRLVSEVVTWITRSF